MSSKSSYHTPFPFFPLAPPGGGPLFPGPTGASVGDGSEDFTGGGGKVDCET